MLREPESSNARDVPFATPPDMCIYGKDAVENKKRLMT